jgi:GAF domain-containing protein
VGIRLGRETAIRRCSLHPDDANRVTRTASAIGQPAGGRGVVKVKCFQGGPIADQRCELSRFRDDVYIGDPATPMDPRGSPMSRDTARVTLSVWEQLAATRDLQAFLTATAETLTPIMDFQGIGAVAFGHDAGFRLLAGWNAAVPAEPGESVDDFHRRTLDAVGAHLPARPRAPYDEEVFKRISDGIGVSCADLLAKDAWYEYEFALAASGMRAYTSLPVFVDGQLAGLAVFTRRAPTPFSAEETRILTDAARAIGVAIARALTDADVERLRHELRQESEASDVQFGHAPFFGDIVGASLGGCRG